MSDRPADAIVPLHVADVTYPNGHPLAGKLGPVLAFAVKGSDGVVLIDTGVVEGNAWIDEHYQPQRREIRDVLRGASIDPADVRLVINTHLHFDHCGGNAAFTGVPICVQHAELDAARADETMREWVDLPGARYEPIDGDTEVAAGVSVLATPGHTAGHQSVVVRTAGGLLLIVGQASQDARSFATGAADASVQRLRDLNAERIHFSHDRAVLRRRPAVGTGGLN